MPVSTARWKESSGEDSKTLTDYRIQKYIFFHGVFWNTSKQFKQQVSLSASYTLMELTIAQIIFHFLWDHCAHCGIFENGVLVMYTLEGVGSVANFITAYEESQ